MKENARNSDATDKIIKIDEERDNLISTPLSKLKKNINSLIDRSLTNPKFYPKLNISLIKGIFFLDNHIKFFTLIKFLSGFILLIVPLIFIIFIVYLETSLKNYYIFFPYFISVSLLTSFLLIFLVMKLNESCRMYGILTLSYERISNLKIAKFIVSNFFLLWLLFVFEDFVFNFNLLKEKVAQSSTKEVSYKLFNEGTYTMRLLFIFLFWDLEKNDKNEYIYNKIGYFEYEEHFFFEFQETVNKLFIPIIAFCFFGILKIILIKTKLGIFYFILYIVTLLESLYFLFYDMTKDYISKDDKDKDFEQEYFKNNNEKYLELIPITIIVILLVILNTKACIINLLHNKYYSYIDKKKDNFAIFFVLSSYFLNTVGYLLFLYTLYNLFFIKINPEFTIEKYNNFWIIIYTSLILIFIGYSFPFGHYIFKLIYHSTEFQYFEHLIKNEFYISSSGNLRKNTDFQKRKDKDKSF